MSASALRLQSFNEHRAALNALVAAVEGLEAPTTPAYPAWAESPASFENGETRTKEEAESLGLDWQDFASKLDDALNLLAFEDFVNELEGLQDLAARCREALIAINLYEAA